MSEYSKILWLSENKLESERNLGSEIKSESEI